MRIIGVVVVILAVTNAVAEERCLTTDTPRQCVQRLITTRAYENAQAALAATNPGTSTVASPIRSAVKDFLRAASANVQDSSVKDSGTSIILDYNFLKQVNLEATFPDPAPSPAAASINAVQQLSRGDDVLVTLSYNLLTPRFGRNIDKSLFDSMLLALISNTAPATAAVPVTAYDTPFAQLLPDAAACVTAMAEYETTAKAALPAVAEQLGKDLADLANRQPQLFGSGLYHRRAPNVGPDEHGFRVTLEIGTDNLNTFRDHEGRDCESRGDCLAAFTNFTARTAKAHRTGRLALAIQYGKTALNDAGAYTEVATDGFTYLATYGQDLSSLTGQPARIDVSYSYDGTKLTQGFTQSASVPHRGAPFAAAASPNAIPPSSVHDSVALTITPSIGRNFSVPLSILSVNHDDWLPVRDPVTSPVSSPISFSIHPQHIRHREKEFVAAIRYQLPSPSHPSQNPSCCCK